jgi:DeoR/GlpR family transcriptional regulator of sugar metabolism
VKTEERRKQIIDHLLEAGTNSVDDLAARFSVSRMTIHRDLDQLEEDGLLRKIRGGASMKPSSHFESDYQYRKRQRVEEKRAIAAAAAQKVEPNQTVLIDDGSTTDAMVEFLHERRPLTVVTNNAATIAQLMDVRGFTLIGLGGLYNKHFHCFYGLQTELALRQLRVDHAFISTSSVSGVYAYHQDQEAVKSKLAMLAAADRRYLLLDHSKFDRTALYLLTDLKEFDAIITSLPPSAAACAALRDADVPLEIVASPGEIPPSAVTGEPTPNGSSTARAT